MGSLGIEIVSASALTCASLTLLLLASVAQQQPTWCIGTSTHEALRLRLVPAPTPSWNDCWLSKNTGGWPVESACARRLVPRCFAGAAAGPALDCVAAEPACVASSPRVWNIGRVSMS